MDKQVHKKRFQYTLEWAESQELEVKRARELHCGEKLDTKVVYQPNTLQTFAACVVLDNYDKILDFYTDAVGLNIRDFHNRVIAHDFLIKHCHRSPKILEGSIDYHTPREVHYKYQKRSIKEATLFCDDSKFFIVEQQTTHAE